MSSKTTSNAKVLGKILVIVESPNKIKKIQAILGSKYEVVASVGHIMDLEPNTMSVDIQNNFKPTYAIYKDKEKVVKELKSAVNRSSDVLIATDGDREGEMIAWSLVQALKLKNPKRIVFYSVTPSELKKAIENPREMDNNLIDAQKSRRILDRIVGYEISPTLCKSIRAQLSAGRVQSVITQLVIDKENEINNFLENNENTYFRINGSFVDVGGNQFKSQLYEKKEIVESKSKTIKKTKKKEEKEEKEEDEKEEKEETENNKMMGFIAKIVGHDNAKNVFTSLTKSKLSVESISDKISTRNPSAPFTTSTLQQEAASKLGFSVKRTDNAAQKLHHAGYVTYIRTDSVSLSEEALNNVKKYVNDTYGKEYYRKMQYKSKKNNAQEAHEAIRPTDVFTEFVPMDNGLNNDDVRLYSLIWKRTVASQMTPAKIDQKILQINIDKLPKYYFATQFEQVAFNGFLAVYNIASVEEIISDEISSAPTTFDNIPEEGTIMNPTDLIGYQDYDRPSSRYTEGVLTKKLDTLGIGRPATSSKIIGKIQDKGYIETKNIDGITKEIKKWCWTSKTKKITETLDEIKIGKESNKLVPTSTGILITDFLVKYFPDIMDYEFTADMEKKLDDIAEGTLGWETMLDQFYSQFHPFVVDLIDKNIDIIDEHSRNLGDHPELGIPIIATIGKHGPMLKMSVSKTKATFAPIKKPLTIETITLEDALKIFEYPKALGKFKKMNIILTKGQHGFYLKAGETNYSLPEDVNPEEVTLDYAKEMIEEKDKEMEEKNKNILWTNRDTKNIYSIKIGPYGNFIEVKSIAPKNKTIKPLFVKYSSDDVTDMSINKVKELVNDFKKKIPVIKKEDKDTKEIIIKLSTGSTAKSTSTKSAAKLTAAKSTGKTIKVPKKKVVKKVTKFEEIM